MSYGFKPYSFDGFGLNTEEVSAIFERGGFSISPNATVEISERSHFPGVMSDKGFEVKQIPLTVVCKGNDWQRQMQTLKSIFDTTNDSGTKTLVVIDCWLTLWKMECYCLKVVAIAGPAITFLLQANDSYLRLNTSQSDAWSISGTGQIHQIAVGGNLASLPIIDIKPTSGKAGGFARSKWVQVYNVIASDLVDYFYDLGNVTFDSASLVADATVSNQINQIAGIGAGDLSIPVDTPVGGGLPTGAGRCFVDSEQIRYTSISAGVMTVPAGGRGVGGTTAAAHADNAVMKLSKVAADGRDFRVYINGAEVPVYLINWNAATSKIWTNLPTLKKKSELTLEGNLLSNPTEVHYQATLINDQIAATLPQAGIFMIDSEAYTYTSLNLTTRQFNGVTAGAKGTTTTTHTAGATIRFIPLDVWFYYDDPALGIPIYSDVKKPLFDLATSTNILWSYAIFQDMATIKPWEWVSAIIQNALGYIYTGPHDTSVNPATEMGMKITNRLISGILYVGIADLVWSLSNPVGFTDVSADGDKYKTVVTNGWPTIAGFEVLIGTLWTNKFSVAAPAAITTWEAWSQASMSLGGTYTQARFRFQTATLAAVANNKALMEVKNASLAVSNANRPVVVIGAEQVPYQLAATLTDLDSGEWIRINANIALNQTLRIDTENKSVVYLKDNSPLDVALVKSSIRFDWLKFRNGTMRLQYDDPGTAGVQITFTIPQRHTT